MGQLSSFIGATTAVAREAQGGAGTYLRIVRARLIVYIFMCGYRHRYRYICRRVCVCVCVCVRVYVGISIYTVVMRHIERDARKAGKRSFYKTASDGYV